MVSPLQSLIAKPPAPVGNAAQDISSLFGAINGFRNTNTQRDQVANQEDQRSIENKRIDSEIERKNTEREIKQGARDAIVALSIKNPEQRQSFLSRRAEELDKQGRDSSDTRAIMALPFEEQNYELKKTGSILLQNYPGSEKAFRGDIIKKPDGTLVNRVQKVVDGQVSFEEYPLQGELVNSLGLTAKEKVNQVKQEKTAGLNAELDVKPEIIRNSKIAEIKGKAEGENLTELEQSRAALPGLNEAVGELKDLASIATSTIGGKIFDAAIKESGFGATEGATARAKFVAIINNQVLPLLKPTFGAAFTVQEGESLKATMGDPDASPEEKIAQLEAFIAQKQRDIKTKSALAGETSQSKPEGQLMEDANGNRAYVYPDGRVEEL
ncbi:MAG: hypothetical protein ACRBCS_03195 [Cellvibrionaceae bacterium]